ncbi:hypothetical protein LZ554_006551 [Drepanopeziza brunnea f. sp. 'monogermtubi']|nr:hypothetical protein LZ554_006551 [Drepanopeziza brunnea f. sp. 'monogermtubi']
MTSNTQRVPWHQSQHSIDTQLRNPSPDEIYSRKPKNTASTPIVFSRVQNWGIPPSETAAAAKYTTHHTGTSSYTIE